MGMCRGRERVWMSRGGGPRPWRGPGGPGSLHCLLRAKVFVMHGEVGGRGSV